MNEIKNLAPVILVLGIAGIVLGLATLVVWEVSETQQMRDCRSTTENLTAHNVTAQSLTNYPLCTTPTMRCDSAMLTYGTEYNVSHTSHWDTGVPQMLLLNDSWNGTSCELNYTYDTQNSFAYNTTTSIQAAFNDFAGWFSLLVLVFVASIIVVIIIRGFGARGAR